MESIIGYLSLLFIVVIIVLITIIFFCKIIRTSKRVFKNQAKKNKINEMRRIRIAKYEETVNKRNE